MINTIELEERFFRVDDVVNEWEWFLDQLGIPKEKQSSIESIEVRVDEFTLNPNG